MAELFFSRTQRAKADQYYGLIVKVGIEFDHIPMKINVEEAEIYNNWVQSQKLTYSVKASFTHSYIIVTPKQINSIKKFI
jgi:hypothetical protein